MEASFTWILPQSQYLCDGLLGLITKNSVSASLTLIEKEQSYPRPRIVLLALHRSFFAQALALKPTDPLDTPYKYSFLSAYEAACAVLHSTDQAFKRKPELLSRVWMIWTFAFSSAVSVFYSDIEGGVDMV